MSSASASAAAASDSAGGASASASESVDRNPLVEGSYRPSRKQSIGKHLMLFSEAVPVTSGDVMTESRAQRLYFREHKSGPWKLIASFADTDACAEAEARTLNAFLMKRVIEETDTVEHYHIDDVLVVCSEIAIDDDDDDDELSQSEEEEDSRSEVEVVVSASDAPDSADENHASSPRSETSQLSSMHDDGDDSEAFVAYRIYRRDDGSFDAKGRKRATLELVASGEGRRSDAMEEASIVH